MPRNVRRKTKKKTTAKRSSHTTARTGDRVTAVALSFLYIFAFLSLLVIGYYFYYQKTKPETVGTAYTDVLNYTEDKPFIAEAKYFSNKASNGKECFEFRMNYYTDTNIPKTEDEYKNVYSSGIQLIDNFDFEDKFDSNYLNKSVYFLAPKSPLYYNSTYGTSYTAIDSLSPSDEWIVDFDGDLGLLVQTEPVVTKQILWVTHYYRYDINTMVYDLFNSVKSLDNGKFILQFDFSKYFNVKKYNAQTGQFDADITTDNKFVFCNVVIEKTENGIIEAEQSLFGIVNKNANWSFSGTHNEDYWEALTNYSLTLADFDVVTQNGKQYLKLKNEAARYLREFGDLIINVVIDLRSAYLMENEIDLYGFSSDAFRGLNITSLSITSDTPRTLYYTDDMPEHRYLENVALLRGGDV